MQKTLFVLTFILCIVACSNNKNLAQTTAATHDSLAQYINSSTPQTGAVNGQLQKLQQENDIVIALATLNYAWVKKGTYYVLVNGNNNWKLYQYEAKLPPAASDTTINTTPSIVENEVAGSIKQMYLDAQLWKTEGDKEGNPCGTRSNCNITDAETWAITVATPENSHTTTYYAPQFFQQCCPDEQRKQFLLIADKLRQLAKGKSTNPEM